MMNRRGVGGSLARRKFWLPRIVGFVIPIPVFVNALAPYKLASGYVDEAALSVPMSLLVLPLALCTALVKRTFRLKSRYLSFALLIAAVVVVSSVLGILSSGSALLYATQWMLPYLWFFYFVSLQDDCELKAFLNAFIQGTFFGLVYILFSAGMEVVIYGGLMDNGRMTQNLVVQGQYQLYVYVPTLIAFSSLISYSAIRFSGLANWSSQSAALLLLMASVALLVLAAREGLLVFLLGLICISASSSWRAVIAWVAGSVVCALLLMVSSRFIGSVLGGVELRIVDKLFSLGEKGRAFAGRDEMISRYAGVFFDDPLVGSGMIPPGVAPSAHNYYVDAFGWGGVGLGAVVIFIGAYLLLKSGMVFAYAIGRQMGGGRFLATCSAYLAIFLLVSNSVNVPLRQPLTGAVAMLLVWFTLSSTRDGRLWFAK